MGSLYKKTISGRPYWYLRQMARVDGKPKMVSERYLGSAADIEALLEAREVGALPARTRDRGKMGGAEGRPKMVWARHLGSAADIEALLEAREVGALPARTRHLGFGD